MSPEKIPMTSMYLISKSLSCGTQRLMKYPRVHSRAIEIHLSIRPEESPPCIEPDSRLIPREDVKRNRYATFTQRLLLHFLHQSARKPSSPIPWRHIQRNDVAHASLPVIFYMQDDEARHCFAFVCDYHARFLRRYKASHGATRKPEGFLKADHIQRVHRSEVIHAIRTKLDPHSRPLR